MKALTIRQPWAELIIRGDKDVENRTWRTNHTGLLVIHAGQGFDAHTPKVHGPFDRGAIIGVVSVVRCIEGSKSPWALPGNWHWLLTDPRRLTKPIPYSGKLGLWDVDPKTVKLIRSRLRVRKA
jgi:hypothetical protein